MLSINKSTISPMSHLIKFRGLREDNVWVYGYVVVNEYNTSIFTADNCRVEVKPESIGQFTGLYTPDNKEIYSDDILLVRLPMGGFWGSVRQEKIGRVRYESDYAGYIVEWDYSKNQHHVLLDCDVAIESELLTNIHQMDTSVFSYYCEEENEFGTYMLKFNRITE